MTNVSMKEDIYKVIYVLLLYLMTLLDLRWALKVKSRSQKVLYLINNLVIKVIVKYIYSRYMVIQFIL